MRVYHEKTVLVGAGVGIVADDREVVDVQQVAKLFSQVLPWNDEGWREFWHWMGMAFFLMLLLLPAFKNRMTSYATAQLALLIVAYTYFHAWVRRGDLVVLVAGAVMVAGYVALNWISTYTWTIVGASVFVAMALGSVVAWRATARQMSEAGEA